MDSRIFFVGDRQLSAIRTQDLPLLALAICGFERGLVSVTRCFTKQVAYVRFTNLWPSIRAFELNVLASDWAKVIPYLAGQPTGTPGPANTNLLPPPPRTSISRDLSNLERWDPIFYAKVYATLQIIFPQSYPTSKL